MAHVKYTGRSDVRILDARDLKRLGVEDFRKTSFPRKEAVEVEDSVAEALTSNKALSREFELVDPDEVEAGEEDEADGPSILTAEESAQDIAGSGTSSGTGGTAGTARRASTASATGAGGSTGGTRRSGRGASTSGAS